MTKDWRPSRNTASGLSGSEVGYQETLLGDQGYRRRQDGVRRSLPNSESELNPQEFGKILLKRRWWFLSVFLGVTALCAAWTWTRPPRYFATSEIMLANPAIPTEAGGGNPTTDALVQVKRGYDFETLKQVLTSPSVISQVQERLQAELPNFAGSPPSGTLPGQLTLQQLPEAQVIQLRYESGDPAEVYLVLNTLQKIYLEYGRQQQRLNIGQAIKFVESQIPQQQQQVAKAEAELRAFRQTYSLVDPQVQSGSLATSITGTEQSRQEAQTQLEEARTLYASLQNRLGFQPDEALAASALSQSTRYQALLDQLQEAELKLAEARNRFRDSHPQVQALLGQRQQVIGLLNQEARNTLGDQLFGRVAVEQSGGGFGSNLPSPGSRPALSAQQNLNSVRLDLAKQLIETENNIRVLEVRTSALTTAEGRLRQQFQNMPELLSRYTELDRDVQVATEALRKMLTVRQELQVSSAQEGVPWQLIRPAVLPEQPFAPNHTRNLILGVMAGTILGSAAALLRHQMDDTLHSVEELKNATPHPLLGSVPYSVASALAIWRQEARSALHTASAATQTPSRPSYARAVASPAHYNRSLYVEALRSLYTNLRFVSSERPVRTFVMTSSMPKEGKSTLCCGLASVIADQGQRVLLVDADLRRPSVHRYLDLPNVRGLSSALVREEDWQQWVQASEVPGLEVMTSGPLPPNPVGLLDSQRMAQLLEDMRHAYDYVIIDAPPALGLTDAAVLAPLTDGVVLVARLGQVTRGMARQVSESLAQVNVLGVVANSVNESGDRYYYQHYYHYYGEAVPENLNTSPARKGLFRK
ncbi:polysaccharide biosynthesis tyrosine autokinase [Leptolyngbya sp. FACHB-261]|uniref:GumC family protein n=1 Tax=Leptolyngbya sp. FACHB-261 TaxID=2692806 RepID=UPI001686915C|nr:polysaccharide biosynthesis tyrosine autokinase [Leptolyngbya sp. FACHB-261]MBD2099633.1 polysaccharide biosynthesis tyrosine autokinase [Leptolyngbya sp. FACHB-261]